LKKRLDVLVVERGLADTRQKAQALIMAGKVLIDDHPAAKAGTAVPDTADVRLKDSGTPYVSRGGLKIEGAAKTFDLQIQDKVCIDLGCSTGGFTHFMLMHGAAKVYGVDVDVTQLDWRLQNDPRVIRVERNARFLEFDDIGELADLVTIDASFISLALLLPRVPAVLKPGGLCLALVKPQFEVGREKVGKGGIVRNSDDQRDAVERISRSGQLAGLIPVGNCESPITGKEGNREFFVLFRNGEA
jgi:23S rRNA (cytidine1920-2'-O)/16S rRNA (cytidine1409-2'-O)-methyltransferase